MHLRKFASVVFCAGSAFMATAQMNRTPLPVSRHSTVIIAHRGNHEHVPENTMASVEEAIKAGTDYVEIDLRTTSDGHLILSHDATVNRMTNGMGAVSNLTFDSIKQLIINGSSSSIYKIPEFKEVLKACKDKMNIYLDFKEADVEETYRQIREAGMENQIVVYLNKEEQYGQWKKTAPAMPLMTSLPDNIKNEKQLDSFLKEKSVQVFDNIYDPEISRLVNQKHISIWLDVQSKNEGPLIWKKALQLNVQGLQTDHPEELIKFRRENDFDNKK